MSAAGLGFKFDPEWRITLFTLLLVIQLPIGVFASSLLGTDTPATMNIDLLPGNADNRINLGKQRLVEIAILGSADFDINDLLGEIDAQSSAPDL